MKIFAESETFYFRIYQSEKIGSDNLAKIRNFLICFEYFFFEVWNLAKQKQNASVATDAKLVKSGQFLDNFVANMTNELRENFDR